TEKDRAIGNVWLPSLPPPPCLLIAVPSFNSLLSGYQPFCLDKSWDLRRYGSRDQGDRDLLSSSTDREAARVGNEAELVRAGGARNTPQAGGIDDGLQQIAASPTNTNPATTAGKWFPWARTTNKKIAATSS